MKDNEFKTWIYSPGRSLRYQSNLVSRIRKIEKEFNVNLDEEYQRDRCKSIMDCFKNMGDNDEMRKYDASFPIGKTSIWCYLFALKKYIEFCDDCVY